MLELIEWLTYIDTLIYTEVNYEYPVNPLADSTPVKRCLRGEIQEWISGSLTDIAKNTPLIKELSMKLDGPFGISHKNFNL